MSNYIGPLPQPAPETQVYFDGLRNRRLIIQRCRTCDKAYFFTRPFCPDCLSFDTEWFEASGRGKLYSYVINHRPEPGLGHEPNLIAVVELDEGPRMMTNLVDVEAIPRVINCDMPVEIVYDDETDEIALPKFRLVPAKEDKMTSEQLQRKVYPDPIEKQLKALEADEGLLKFKEAREGLASDPYRPIYHFSPPGSVMNDPNGLCYWKGCYHLFYQYRPGGEQDRVHWGHTVSDDLIHWRDLPLALYPDQEKDCYSGQTLVEPDRVIAIYHGTEAGNAIATASDPLLLNWEKHPNNPVIPIVPIDENGLPYRVFDPCIWKEDDGYYAVSGTYKDGERGIDCLGVDHLFRSKDLAKWEYLGPLMEDTFFAERGEDAAVPAFWPIGNGKHMLILFSHKRAGRYYIGDYDTSTHRFTPEVHGRMNYGPWVVGSLHAPSATVDERGRFLAFFNVKEGKPAEGWDNIMTLPRHYWLDENNSLEMAPAQEVESLRFGHKQVSPMDIPANDEIILDEVRGKAIEIEAVIEPGDAREVGLCVLLSPDGSEQTRISFFPQDHRRFDMSSLQIDVSTASLRSDVFARTPEIGPMKFDSNEQLRLRVFVDRTIVEVFANDRQCLTIRVYPEREDSNGVSLFSRGSSSRLVSLDVWEMRSIWPELKHREGK